jgi:hypothetical protein
VSRRRRRLLFGAAALLVPVVVLAVAVRLAPFPAVPASEGEGSILGFFHLHTTHSHDGHGTLEEAARAARRLGARFLVPTEHNLLEPREPTVIEGVLVVPAVEISADAGHVVALGVGDVPEERGPAVLDAIAAKGGMAVLAHPVNLRRPWSDPATEGFVGFEALSLDSAFREATLAHRGRLFWPLFALAGDRRKLAALLMHRPDDALRRYDEIADERELAMLCGVDAHGLPPYLSSFAALGLHIRLSPAEREAWGRDPAADARAVLEAIGEARTFCSVPALGDASSFSLRAEDGQVVAEVATEEATIVLLRAGREVARGRGPAVRAPWAPGPWRAEVYVEPGFPWGGARLWIASSARRLPLTPPREGS